MPKMTTDEWIAYHLARSPEPTREQLEGIARILARPTWVRDPEGRLRSRDGRLKPQEQE
jgi:hypothetical protein